MSNDNFVGTFTGMSNQCHLSNVGLVTSQTNEPVSVKITKQSNNIYLIRINYPKNNLKYTIIGTLMSGKIYSLNTSMLSSSDPNILNTYYNIFYFNSKGKLRNHSSGTLDGYQYARISKFNKKS